MYDVIARFLSRQEHTQRQKNALAESYLPHEDAVAQRWWSLPANTILPLSNGDTCRLLFPGRPGGPAGPDVRDAVLDFAQEVAQQVGDVEFHVRASDWGTHKHHTDPRYNGVMLHIVLLCDDAHPTTRQDGKTVPVCSLYDIPIVRDVRHNESVETVWPCHSVMHSLNSTEREALLQRAGLLRFEQKTHAFVEQLHSVGDDKCDKSGCDKSDPYSDCLVLALAEGLAYGRDRAFFRAAAQRLLGKKKRLPEPLGRASEPAPLDVKRLHVLHTLISRRQDMWHHLHSLLLDGLHEDEGTIVQSLRTYFHAVGLGLARTDILLCNVVFPFAAAVALIEHDTLLGIRAQHLYEMHPGLTSNTITRTMCTQLQLVEEPHGSCRQQGLHYIYQQTCRAKHCAECMMGRRIL